MYSYSGIIFYLSTKISVQLVKVLPHVTEDFIACYDNDIDDAISITLLLLAF